MKKIVIYISFLFFATSCVRLQEARQIAIEADSLRAYNIVFEDSIRLAKSAHTLDNFIYRNFYPKEFACINYYYGKLLRKKGNQLGAMRCFIKASHTDPETAFSNRIGVPFRQINTEEYNILGRTYSNMGSMCHLEHKYQLSFDLFSKSTKQFKLANNKRAYYYGLCSMAFELAKQNKKQETLSLLSQVDTTINDSILYSEYYQVKTLLYRNLQMYDSALFCVNKELEYCNNNQCGVMMKAQILSSMGIKDSALIYAAKCITPNATLENLSNAYYILQHDDNNISIDSVNILSANRTDVNDILDCYHDELAQAILLVEQDNSKKTNYIYLIIALTLLLVIFLIILWQKRQQYKIVKERQKLQTETQTEQSKQYILRKKQQVIIQKNELLKKESKQLEQDNKRHKEDLISQINNNCKALQQSHDIKKEISLDNYNTMCEIVNKLFYMFANKLKATQKLNKREIQLCVLVLVGEYSSKQLAELLCYSQSGIRNLKSITAKKLNTNSKNLRNALMKIALNGQI